MQPSIVHSTHCNTVTTHVTYDTLNTCQLQHYKVYCTTNSVIILTTEYCSGEFSETALPLLYVHIKFDV
jgi:hypothetical protein